MKLILALTALLVGTAVARDLATTPIEARPAVTYFGDGTLKSSTTWVDGMRSGPSEQFYSDGQPRSRGAYEQGLRTGEWTFWNADGSIDSARTGPYVAGHLTR